MKDIKKLVLITSIFIVLFIVFYSISNFLSKYTGFYIIANNDLDLCIQSKNIALYIHSDNTNDFLKSFKLLGVLKNLDIINCYRNNNLCIENNIKSYPTWIIDNTKIEKDLNIDEFFKITGCKLAN
jgi:hypothetical protein